MRIIFCLVLIGMLVFTASVDSKDVELGSAKPGEKAKAKIAYTFQSDESPPPVYRISFQGKNEVETLPCLIREETNGRGRGLGNYDKIELKFNLVVRGIREVSFANLSAKELLEKKIVMPTDQKGEIEVLIDIETAMIAWANDSGEYRCSLTIVFSKVSQEEGSFKAPKKKGDKSETRKKQRESRR